MNLDGHIEELEAGFRDILAGVSAVLKVLRDENALLRARLDERRQMHSAVVPERQPVADVEPPAIVHIAAPVLVAVEPPKKKYPPKMLSKPCERCHESFEGRAKTRFCNACFRAQAGERLGNARAQRLHASGHYTDDRFVGEIDRRIASGT